MSFQPIHRRTMLRGLGGAIVALPFLEAMLPRRASAANGNPCRYVAFFAGLEHRACVPSGTGAGYTLPTGLASVPAPALPVPSLEDLRDRFSVVSGTGIEGTGPSGVTPPGGKANPHHGNIMKPLLTGYRSTTDDNGVVTSSTPDQLVADLWGTDTKFRSLQYRVQPIGYRAGTGSVKGVLSYDGSQALVPQTSPQLAYESLFSGFVPPDASPDDLEAHEKLIARKLSVLDLVERRADRLIPRLSGYDRRRLEQHFDQIRDLERRLAEIPPVSGGDCAQLTDPGPDPTEDSYPNTEHGGSAGYSGEDERGHVMVDLVHMALACDLTRVASIMITQEQSVMSIAPLFGANYEMHDVTHNDIPDRSRVWDELTTWHAGFFAKLVDKLSATPEPTGGTMLDTTAVTLTYSGGPSGHGGTNMPILVAGVPSMLRMGEHISVSGHPCQVFQTVLHALGIDESLGDLPGLQPSMLV
jgi:hypothetical protein